MRAATFLAAVATATAASAQSLPEGAHAAILNFDPNPDLGQEAQIAIADCHIAHARNDAQLDGLANATSAEDLTIFLRFATIEARYCTEEVGG